MMVIMNKLKAQAVGRFKNFLPDEAMNRMPFEVARQFCNVMIVDMLQSKVLFDANSLEV